MKADSSEVQGQDEEATAKDEQQCIYWREIGRVCLRVNQLTVNSLPINDRDSRISLVGEVLKSGNQAHTKSTGKWGKAQDWRLLADVGRQLQVPQCIVLYFTDELSRGINMIKEDAHLTTPAKCS